MCSSFTSTTRTVSVLEISLRLWEFFSPSTVAVPTLLVSGLCQALPALPRSSTYSQFSCLSAVYCAGFLLLLRRLFPFCFLSVHLPRLPSSTWNWIGNNYAHWLALFFCNLSEQLWRIFDRFQLPDRTSFSSFVGTTSERRPCSRKYPLPYNYFSSAVPIIAPPPISIGHLPLYLCFECPLSPSLCTVYLVVLREWPWRYELPYRHSFSLCGNVSALLCLEPESVVSTYLLDKVHSFEAYSSIQKRCLPWRICTNFAQSASACC